MESAITFLGAARNVTGSRYLLECGNSHILVDCGLHQERAYRARDWEPFAFPPDRIDAVILTHAHLDHCGYLPKLVADGFSGPIFCTPASADIAKIVLRDAAYIMAEDAKHKQRRHDKEKRKSPRVIRPLYTEEDVTKLGEEFVEHYTNVYGEGGAFVEGGIEIVNLRITATVKVPTAQVRRRKIGSTDSKPALKEKRDVYWTKAKGFINTNIYDYLQLDAGMIVDGPAVVEAPTTTFVVLPEMTAKVDEFLNIILER